MAKILIKVSTGEVFTISNSFYGRSGPMKSRQDAEVQMSFIYKEMAALGTDQGPVVNIQHVAYSWIED